MKVSDYIVEYLRRKGIEEFFGFQGTMIAHLVDSIERNPGTRNHSCYHEQGAAFAACGYAQAKGSCACAYATSGPGAVNLLSGIADAYYDSLPVIFLTGQLNTYEYSGIEGLRQQGFQETDIISMAKPVTKYAVQIRRAQDIVEVLQTAYTMATEGRKGPVLIDLPMDMQRGEADPGPDWETGSEHGEAVPENTFTAEAEPAYEYSEAVERRAKEAADEIRRCLKSAERPVVMMGAGLSREGCAELLEMAGKLNIPVITSVLAKTMLPYDHPLNFGCIGGAYGHRYANMIAGAKSDLILAFGISLCTRQIGTKVHEFAKKARIIRIDLDPANLQRQIHAGGENEITACTDAALTVHMLAGFPDLASPAQNGDWLQVCRKIRQDLQAVDEQTPDRWPNRLIRQICRLTAGNGAVAVDVGQHMVWTYQSYENAEGEHMLFSGGHGAMGYALPAAIGAYYACKKPVLCITGDGALSMNIQELQWIRRENLPVHILVMNNQSLGMIRHLQRDYFENLYAGTSPEGGFTSADFSAVAAAYKIPSIRLLVSSDVQDLQKAVPLLNADGPSLTELVMEPGTYAYPKTCLGEPVYNQQPYAPEDVYQNLLNL